MTKRLTVPQLACAAALAVAACGGGSDNDVPAPPAPIADSFTAAVQQVSAASPDDGEPVSIDGVRLAEIDDREPQALQ